MRVSQLFGKTQREIPGEAETISHQLLLRAGMINQLTAGVYSMMPLAWRTARKIMDIIREEMDAAGCQEITMPVLQPVDLWEKSGRGAAFGANLFKLQDRKERTLALGPTHEEVVTSLAAQYIQSYRDLPQRLYQIQTKLRDEPRPRGGLIRVREFIMKDMYSFDADEAGLEVSYQKMVQAYKNIYKRCGLRAIAIEADSGAIGGKASHEFMVLAESGEDEVIFCSGCGYAANVEKAKFDKGAAAAQLPLPIEEVATPGKESIEDVAAFLSLAPSQMLKCVFYVADKEFIIAVIRGDLEINEVKLKNLLKATDLRLATAEEVTGQGIIAGSASPVGHRAMVITDDSIVSSVNYVGGANVAGRHMKNIVLGRDFNPYKTSDIASASVGAKCSRCGGTLESTRGIEVGHVFKLGTFLAETFGATYADAEGNQRPCIMGCYGIGVGRLLAAAIEQNHDDKGIIWPMPIAPYQVQLCALSLDNERVRAAAEKLYEDLRAAGVEVLYDDRIDSPGVKFNDADLLGMPIRITISPRSLDKGGMELKKRNEKAFVIVTVENAVAEVKAVIEREMPSAG
ncbi:proline--tRNA ligase [Dehalogenimonas alkenigignens]|uniref:Proline--tRNA ligase n=1 Tax=Dehalogenimonas alkenigignens TaxID=1217799 RepID=A0A0W0GH61_9CHLR|nr:proline--tRNA ligase [Dehalogenimonas alkenigignens]KTB47893.1 prolyl-tRNA synthetase [Dehalogenimonas alkenigignens]PVV83914.1 proline--tRNA ligase [Dehalogenimonas alkenigignens]